MISFHKNHSISIGTYQLNLELESLIAKFLKVDDVVTVGMGFATNATAIPAFLNSDSLVLSDSLNHSSIVLGCRLGNCDVKVFRHNGEC